MTEKLRGWIGVDLDGTLAEHENVWNGISIGKPVPRMVERVKRWLAQGIEVRILTARAYPLLRDAPKHKIAIMAWTKELFGEVLTVTCMKDPEMIELWDDRAITVQSNTGELVHPISPFDDECVMLERMLEHQKQHHQAAYAAPTQQATEQAKDNGGNSRVNQNPGRYRCLPEDQQA